MGIIEYKLKSILEETTTFLQELKKYQLEHVVEKISNLIFNEFDRLVLKFPHPDERNPYLLEINKQFIYFLSDEKYLQNEKVDEKIEVKDYLGIEKIANFYDKITSSFLNLIYESMNVGREDIKDIYFEMKNGN